MNKYIIAAAALSFLAAPAAHALTIDQTDFRGIGLTPTELDTSFFFPGYTGTEAITTVLVTFGGAIDGSLTLTNGSLSSQTVQASSESAFFFTSDDVVLPAPPQISASGGTGFQSLAGESSQTFAIGGSATDMFSFTGSDVSQFLAPFTINLFTVSGFSSLGGGGNISIDQTTNASADVTVEYGFEEGMTVIPLPAAAWMLLAGLGSILAFRRLGTV